jgi:hypothetical protein
MRLGDEIDGVVQACLILRRSVPSQFLQPRQQGVQCIEVLCHARKTGQNAEGSGWLQLIMERALPGGDTMIEKTLIEFSRRAGDRPMTDNQTTDEIIAGIFGPPPSARERELGSVHYRDSGIR